MGVGVLRWRGEVAFLLAHAVLGFGNDAGHGFDDEHGVLAGSSFGAQHHRVGAVENRVRDVAGFGTRGHGVLDHRFEHLRCDDARLATAAADLDDLLLHDRHFGDVHLNTQIASCDHGSVAGFDDCFEVLDGLGHFDLGDNRNPSGFAGRRVIHRGDALLELDDFIDATHEAEGEPIHFVRDGPRDAFHIAVGDCWCGEFALWYVDAFVAADSAAYPHAATQFALLAISLDREQSNCAIVDEHLVTGFDFVDELLIGERQHEFAAIGVFTFVYLAIERVGNACLEDDVFASDDFD